MDLRFRRRSRLTAAFLAASGSLRFRTPDDIATVLCVTVGTMFV